MPQNVYDNLFFNEYIKFPRQVQGLDGAPAWPSIRAILPGLTAKRVLDLGCGFGWAREDGHAKSVLGLDVSENMLRRARSTTTDTEIEYRQQDLEVLELPEASFDFAYSALALHYIEDFDRLVRMIHKAPTTGSHFVFEIEHPIFMAARNAEWIEIGAGKAWPVNAYGIEGERRNEWVGTKGVLEFHRTMSTTVNTRIGADLRLSSFKSTRQLRQSLQMHQSWHHRLSDLCS